MLASGLAAGLAAGLASGGRIARLRSFSVHWLPVLAIVVVARLVAPATGDLAAATYVGAFAGVAAVALRNATLLGMPLIAAGAILNLAVVAANGAMPISLDALTSAGATMPVDRLHGTLVAGTSLSAFADVIPLSPLRAVYSLGDVLIAFGGAALAYRAVRG